MATCYHNASYTRNWAPNKASHENLHPKLCRILLVIQFSTWNRLAPRSNHLAKIGSRSLGRALGVAGCHPIEFWSMPNFTTHRLTRPLSSPSASSRILLQSSLWGLSLGSLHRSVRCHTVIDNLLVFGTLEYVPMNLFTQDTQFTQNMHP